MLLVTTCMHFQNSKDLKHVFLGEILDGLPFPSECKSQMREVFNNHDSVREKITGYHGQEPDLTWRGSWSKAAEDVRANVVSCGAVFSLLLSFSESSSSHLL